MTRRQRERGAAPRRGDAAQRNARLAPWLGLAAVLGATYLVFLDRTMLGIALPHIADDLGVAGGGVDVDWVVTTFLVAAGVALPLTGWLAETRGHKRAYLEAVAVFVAGSIVSGSAPALGWLLAGRAIQGLAAGVMMPLSLAIAYELFPPAKRGAALGVWGVAALAAPAIGPPLGGWFVVRASWRWVFLMNLPIGVIALAAAAFYLGELRSKEEKRLEWRVWMAAAIGMMALIVASRQALAWGPGSPGVLSLLIGGVAAFVYAVRASLRSPDPLIEVRVFAIRSVAASMTVISLKRIGQLARLTFLPIALQTIYGFDALQVGAMFTAEAVGMMMTMAIGGWLADRFGARVLVAAGLSVVAAVTWGLGHLGADTTRTTIVLLLGFGGLANGFTVIPNSLSAMNSVPTRLAPQVAAARSIVRELVSAIGLAALAAFVVSRLGAISPEAASADAQATYNMVFRITAGVMLAAAATGALLPGRRKMRELQRLRGREDGVAAEVDAV